MILALLKKYWKYIVLAIALVVIYWAIYNQGYNSAYSERTEYYNAKLVKDNKTLITKLDAIESLALSEDFNNKKNHDSLVADLSKLNTAIKNKQLTTLKNGECVPSKEFLDSYNSIILRGNK